MKEYELVGSLSTLVGCEKYIQNFYVKASRGQTTWGT